MTNQTKSELCTVQEMSNPTPDYKQFGMWVTPRVQVMKKWDRENDSPCCDTVETPMMPLKAEKKAGNGYVKYVL